jgi:hypothetical protein
MLRLLALLFFAALNGEVFAANDWVNLLAQDPTGGLVTGHVCYSTNGHDLSCDAGAPTITSGTLYVATSVSSTAGYFGTVSATTYYGDGSHLSGVGAGDRIVSGTLLAVANSATGYISLTTGAANWGYLSSGISYLPNLQTSTLSATVISVTAVQIVSQSTSPVTCNSGNSGTLRYNSPTTTLELCNGSGWQPMGVGIPAGTISAFASTTCPTGWSEFTTARGRFLRGIDNGAGLDPNGTRAPGGTQVDMQLALRLQMAFGLRLEESLKFRVGQADRGDHIALQASWCKGGRAREVKLTHARQRALLDEVRAVCGSGAIIPQNKSYIGFRKEVEHATWRAGIHNMHGHRHWYAQWRYRVLTGRPSPAAGGETYERLSRGERARDYRARMQISSELGHNRLQITDTYLGGRFAVKGRA